MRTLAAIARVLSGSRRRRGRAGGRRGMNLMEIMIVVAILAALFALAIPAVTMLFRLEQKQVASRLAIQYAQLRDEALLNNVSFRIAYHLEEGYYEIEVGDPEVLLFTDAESREAYEGELEEAYGSPAEQAAKGPAEGPEEIVLGEDGQELEQDRFSALADTFHKKVALPSGTVFGGVYTPQYAEMMEPDFDLEAWEDRMEFVPEEGPDLET